jgi:hypothetical protein
MEKMKLMKAMNTAVSVTGRKNWISGTATSARPKPVNPLIMDARKMISDKAIILVALITLFAV